MKKRTVCVSLLLIGSILLGIGRVAQLTLGSPYSSVADQQSLFTLTVQPLRGKIFDRNGQSLTQNEPLRKVAVAPNPQVISYVHRHCSHKEKQALLQQLSGRRPFLFITDTPFSVTGATPFTCHQWVPSRQTAVHTVGYLDSSGRQGVCGLEKAYQQLLYTSFSQTVTYRCDATGGVLAGIAPRVDIPALPTDFGVHTTLDRQLQQQVEAAFPTGVKGAVVVQSVGSGELLGLYSAPDFSPADIASAADDPALPLINRTLLSYNVGSVFKLCVAAAALEQGISPHLTYTCQGSITCSIPFACHKTQGHGPLTMTEALAHSCNTYFIHLATLVGGQAIYDMALSMGLGSAAYLCDGLVGEAGSLPLLQELLRSPAELANFAIGQGILMATPLQITAMTQAIANGGVYHTPRLLNKTVSLDGKTRDWRILSGKRIVSTQTAQALSTMMEQVVTVGTGTAANCPDTPVAGKTATAQTGIQAPNGNPVTQAWFTGFFPADQPEYVVTVLVEGGSSGGQQAAPIFRKICEAIMKKEP